MAAFGSPGPGFRRSEFFSREICGTVVMIVCSGQ